MAGFVLTVISDASMNYFPENTITNFKNRLATRIDLDGEYDVSLTKISYTSTNVIIKKGEVLGVASYISKSRFVSAETLNIGGGRNWRDGDRESETGFVIKCEVVAARNYRSLTKLCNYLTAFTHHKYEIQDGELHIYTGEGNPHAYYKFEISTRIKQLLGMHNGLTLLKSTKKVHKEFTYRGNLATHLAPSWRVPGEFTMRAFQINADGTVDKSKIIGEHIADKAILDQTGISYNLYRFMDLKEIPYGYGYKHLWFWFKPPVKEFPGEFNPLIAKNFNLDEFITINEPDGRIQYQSKNDINVKYYVLKGTVIAQRWENEILKEEYKAKKDHTNFGEMMDDLCESLQIGWKCENNKVYLSILDRGDFEGHVRLTNLMKYYLGMLDGEVKAKWFKGLETDIDEYIANERVYEDFGNSILFVYCDLCENQIVGGSFAPLLRTLPVKYNQDKAYEHEFYTPLYIPMRKLSFQDVHIYI
jgi:hypothetical protein